MSPTRVDDQQPGAPRDHPILLPAGSPEELIAQHRDALRALAGDAPNRARGALHLAIGLCLARVEEASLAEAIEELRQALALLAEDDVPLDHATTRHHLGCRLLEHAMQFVEQVWWSSPRRARPPW